MGTAKYRSEDRRSLAGASWVLVDVYGQLLLLEIECSRWLDERGSTQALHENLLRARSYRDKRVDEVNRLILSRGTNPTEDERRELANIERGIAALETQLAEARDKKLKGLAREAPGTKGKAGPVRRIVDRLNELLAAMEETARAVKVVSDQVSGSVVFNHVSYRSHAEALLEFWKATLFRLKLACGETQTGLNTLDAAAVVRGLGEFAPWFCRAWSDIPGSPGLPENVRRECWDAQLVPLDDRPVYLGGGKVRVGGRVIQLTEAEGEALQALIEMGGAASLRNLNNRSGSEISPRHLKSVAKKYPDLAPHIHFPGRKGAGGYSTTIAPE